MNAIVVMVVLVVVGNAIATHASTPKPTSQTTHSMASNIMDLLKSIFVSNSKENNNPEKNIKKIIKNLKDKGYKDKTIAGIVANIELETGGTFDYKQNEVGEGTGYGLFQYSNEMKDSYEDYVKDKNKNDSMETQLDFMDEVVKGKWEPGLSNMDKTILKGELFSGKAEPERVAESFNSIFEKGELETDYGNRRDLATKIYGKYFND
tara:strand:+ start:177 stop:797 length:621 start_codon:yes stop_codon:yes gene_type:complete